MDPTLNHTVSEYSKNKPGSTSSSSSSVIFVSVTCIFSNFKTIIWSFFCCDIVPATINDVAGKGPFDLSKSSFIISNDKQGDPV